MSPGSSVPSSLPVGFLMGAEGGKRCQEGLASEKPVTEVSEPVREDSAGNNCAEL